MSTRETARLIATLGFILTCLAQGCGNDRAEQPRSNAGQPRAQAEPERFTFKIEPRFEAALFYLENPAEDVKERAAKVIKAVRPSISIVDTFSKELTTMEIRVVLEPTTNYVPPDETFLGYFGRGLSAEQVKAVQESKHALIVVALAPPGEGVAMVRDMNEIIARLQATADTLIFDAETREMFTAEAWKTTRMDSWEGDLPRVPWQITLHSYPMGDLTRCVSLGMVKFGFPDIAVNEVPRSYSASVQTLVNLISQTRIETKSDPNSSLVSLDIDALRHAKVRQSIMDSLIGEPARRAAVSLASSTPDDGDPDNELVEVVFGGGPNDSLQVKQQRAIAELFGSKDGVQAVKHDEAMNEASRKARQLCINEKKPLVQKGLPPGERLLVKAPFATPDRRSEWMWVEVTKWEGEKLHGILMNDPYYIPDLHAGAKVDVDEATIFDYIHYLADGATEGNTTGKMMQEREKGGGGG